MYRSEFKWILTILLTLTKTNGEFQGTQKKES